MTNSMIRIHNAETQEVVDREMTAEELQEWQVSQARQEAKALAEAEAEAAKAVAQAKLAALGLTTDDLKALGL